MADETLLFDQTLKQMELVFRCGGINIKSSELKPIDYIKSRIVYLINFFWLNMDLSGAIFWFIDGVRIGRDFLGLTYIAPCIFLTSLANIKALLLVLNEKHVHKLIENLRNLEIKAKKRDLSKEEVDLVNKEKDFLSIVITVLSWLYVLVDTTFALSPIVIMAVKYASTKELEFILPFLVVYPFDPFTSKVWPFVYLHQIWSETIVSLNILSADCFFFICCTYIRIQFKLLQHSISNIIPEQNSTNRKYLNNDDYKTKFKDLVRWHQELIESVQIMEKIYSKSTLLNFVTSSLVICLTGFNVTMMVNDIAFVVTFLAFLFVGLFQIFFLCFFADLLMVASMEVSDAVYNTQWYMADASIGKNLSIMQIRGQKPCKLTAYGFADVNLNSFMRVLSTAWSYFALLQTIYGN